MGMVFLNRFGAHNWILYKACCWRRQACNPFIPLGVVTAGVDVKTNIQSCGCCSSLMACYSSRWATSWATWLCSCLSSLSCMSHVVNRGESILACLSAHMFSGTQWMHWYPLMEFTFLLGPMHLSTSPGRAMGNSTFCKYLWTYTT